ncbi:hypothetical protein ES705_03592 [subsurface metagenome]|uniref:SCP2 domain-containing protein n=1 Tax=marine sediment metagenome TaxID=412755 RepID=X1FX52_9ZZZZ
MAEEKTKRLKGFAKVVAKEVEVLNTIEQFKEDFKDSELKILLNAKDGKYAALLVIDKGKVYVESIENKPKENIKKKYAGWDGFLEAKMQLFVELLGGGDISMGSIIWKILTFRIKIKGIKNVLTLLKLFEYE